MADRFGWAFAVFLLVSFIGAPAHAQMQLPGAMAPGTSPTPAAKPKPAAPPVSRGEESLPGRILTFMGGSGRLMISRRIDKGFAVSIAGTGRRGNDIRQACTVDLSGGMAVPLSPKGRPDGLPRFEAKLPACTLQIDFLADAVLVTTAGGACRFADDCAVDPSGLWGPAGNALPPEAEIERARSVAERQIIDGRKQVQAKLRKPDDSRAFITDHVNFISNRERICRSYSGTQGPGFCALKYSEGHAAKLAARAASSR